MTRLVRRVVLRYDELRPGEYVAVGRRHLHGGLAIAIMRCPSCERLSATTHQQHSVDHEGVVTPAVICPHEGCDFDQDVVLDDWVPESRGYA